MSGFSINTVCLSGNLTRDPELKTLGSGTSVCEVGLAVNERVKQGDDWVDRPNFFDITVWGKIGEWVAKNMSKGDGLAVEGRLRFESWETEDGSKRSKVKVVANSIVPRNGGGGNGGGSGRDSSSSSAPAADNAPAQVPANVPPTGDDAIPF